MQQVLQPFVQIVDLNGMPLNGGSVYFGTSNLNPETNQITVYWDSALTQPAAQPIKTINGYLVRDGVISDVYVPSSYSMTAKDKRGNLVFYKANADGNQLSTLLAATTGAGLIGWIRNAIGAVATTIGKWLQYQRSSVFEFMTDAEIADAQSGAPVLDHTAAILAYKAHAVLKLPFTMYFPKGKFNYTSLGNLAFTGLTIEGASHRQTVLKCTGSGNAIYIDAFQAGLTGNDATAPFIQQCNMKDFTVEGNTAITQGFNVQGIARCDWKNVYVREGNSATGIAFLFKGCMLSTFDKIGCSTDLDAMTFKPYEGLRLDEGRRAGVSVGNSSNNTFINAYMEGLSIGIRILLGDQNTFISGSPESNSVYGLLVGTGSRYNTFIGTGFENPSSTADIADAGISTRFLNIYSSKSVILQGRNAEINGGYFERIQIDALAAKNKIHDLTINHWATGSGGYVDNGVATEWRNIYDEDAAAFIYPIKVRTAIAVGASPSTWVNTTGKWVEVIIQDGTLTQVRQLRPGPDNWLRNKVPPCAVLLAPLDSIEISYSVAPTAVSYIPMDGI